MNDILFNLEELETIIQKVKKYKRDNPFLSNALMFSREGNSNIFSASLTDINNNKIEKIPGIVLDEVYSTKDSIVLKLF